MQNIIMIWLIVALVCFTIALAMTPPDSINASEIVWLALLAALWPFILTFSAIGMLLTLLASLTYKKR